MCTSVLRVAVLLCRQNGKTAEVTRFVTSAHEQSKKPFQCSSWLCPSNALHRTVIPQCFVFSLLFDWLLAVGPVEWNEEQCNSLLSLSLSLPPFSLLSSAPSPFCASQTLSCLARINSLASGQSHFLPVGGGLRCRGKATTKGYTTARPPFAELSQGYRIANFGCLHIATLFFFY